MTANPPTEHLFTMQAAIASGASSFYWASPNLEVSVTWPTTLGFEEEDGDEGESEEEDEVSDDAL